MHALSSVTAYALCTAYTGFLTQVLNIKREREYSNNVIAHVNVHAADFMQCGYMQALRCKGNAHTSTQV